MTTSEQLLIKHLKKSLEKIKRRTARLPVDMTRSGEFPQKDVTEQQRSEDIKFLAGYLHDVMKPVAEERARRVSQVMKEVARRKAFFDFIVHGAPEVNETVRTIRRFMRQREGIKEAVLIDRNII